ncbi:MBL fold metallo-hydrolase [bacterium]|nr:MBL fold metallo-hydrolase [bacterium]
MEAFEIIRKGDDNGNHAIVKFVLSSSLVVYGLATKNFYGGKWDTGPTWNYLVMAEKPFLVDTGRTNTSKSLIEMMEVVGLSGTDLTHILLTHGHEDHDGGLSDIVKHTGAEVLAHPFYSKLILFYPEQVPAKVNKNFPPSCWHCFMPEEYSTQYCLDYHRDRNRLQIKNIETIKDTIDNHYEVKHLPGHHPDAVAIFLDHEAILVGDNLLPDISPFPSKESFFDQIQGILKPDFPEAETAFGLKTYIRSLKRLIELEEHYPEAIILPGHRLYTNGQWNRLNMKTRAEEIIVHHLERCSAILDILQTKSGSPRDIAVSYYDDSVLGGLGIYMAINEIESHLELLISSGDIIQNFAGDYEYISNHRFESLIGDL